MHLAPDGVGDQPAQCELDLPPRRRTHLLTALKQIEERRPAAVLFGGDNANRSVSQPAYCTYTAEFLERFPAPHFAIPGNHDVGSTVGWHHHDRATMTRACSAFVDAFGPDHWVLEQAGFRILALNSQIFGSSLPEAGRQHQWLQHELPKSTELLRVVFLHTPPYLKQPDDNFDDGSEQMCLRPQARASLLALLDQHPPDLVITAHAHRFWQRREPKWDWLGLPSTAFGQHEMTTVPSHNLPEGDDRVGWVALERDGAGWRATFNPI